MEKKFLKKNIITRISTKKNFFFQESEDAFYPKAPMFDDSTLPAEYKKKVPDSLKNQ